MHRGYVLLWRKIQDSKMWKEKPFTKAMAWMDIIMETNHADKKVSFGMEYFECKRGDSFYSLETWAERWGWSRSMVFRYFRFLSEDGMISVLKTTQKTTHIRVCNYATYQNKRNADETQMKRRRNVDETSMNTNKELEGIKKELEINNSAISASNQDNGFEDFWKLYPRKQGKGGPKGARGSWVSAIKKCPALEIIAALKNQLPELLKKDPQYIPLPATWLNQERWTDEQGSSEKTGLSLFYENQEKEGTQNGL